MKPGHQRRINTLCRRRDYLYRLVEESEDANQYDVLEYHALEWAIRSLEEADRTGVLERLDTT